MRTCNVSGREGSRWFLLRMGKNNSRVQVAAEVLPGGRIQVFSLGSVESILVKSSDVTDIADSRIPQVFRADAGVSFESENLNVGNENLQLV